MPNEQIIRAATRYPRRAEACAYVAFQLRHLTEDELREAFELLFALREWRA